jgi:hypothetical protein
LATANAGGVIAPRPTEGEHSCLVVAGLPRLCLRLRTLADYKDADVLTGHDPQDFSSGIRRGAIRKLPLGGSRIDRCDVWPRIREVRNDLAEALRLCGVVWYRLQQSDGTLYTEANDALSLARALAKRDGMAPLGPAAVARVTTAAALVVRCLAGLGEVADVVERLAARAGMVVQGLDALRLAEGLVDAELCKEARLAAVASLVVREA